MKLSFDVLFPGPNGPRGLHRMHWATRASWKRRLRDAIEAQTTSDERLLMSDQTPVVVHYERRSLQRPMDRDNLTASLKLPLDALVQAGVLPDDSPEHVRLGTIQHVRVKKKADQGCILKLEPVSSR